MRALDDTGAGRSGGGIADIAEIWPLVRDHVFKQGLEFLNRGSQFGFDLAAFLADDCVAKLGALS